MSSNVMTGINASIPPIPTAIAEKMLITPTEILIAGTACELNTFQPGEGIAKMFVGVPRFPDLEPVTSNATQGPPPFSPNYYSVTITAQLFSQATIIPVTATISSQIPWLTVIVNHQRIASFNTEDKIIATALLNTANSLMARYGTNQQFPTEPSQIDFARINTALTTASAPNSTQGIEASRLFNTYGMRPGYIMLTSTQSATVFTTQAPSEFTQYGAASQPEHMLPGELGYVPQSGIRVLASPRWPQTGLMTTGGYPIFKASVVSYISYTKLISPSMYHRSSVVGSSYLGINNLQEGASINWWGGSSILQPTWVLSFSYSGITQEVA